MKLLNSTTDALKARTKREKKTKTKTKKKEKQKDVPQNTLMAQLPLLPSITNYTTSTFSTTSSSVSSSTSSVSSASTETSISSACISISSALSKKSSSKRAEKSKKKKSSSSKKKHQKKEDPISSAILTEDGIKIRAKTSSSTSNSNSSTPNPYSLSNSTSNVNSTLTINTSTTSFRSSTDSHLETASLISCVTCLSDNPANDSQGSNNNSHTTTSVNGQLPDNVVIPYGRILNAKYIDPIKKNNLIEIVFAKPRRHDVIPKKLTVSIENQYLNGDLLDEIMDRSYKNTKRNRSILVVINPFGGKRKAKKVFMSKAKPLLLASECSIDIAYTEYIGHGIKIAQELDIDKYDTIACASGDGIPHEIMNGLYRRPDRVKAFNKLAITQIPCGSGNAMSVSCHWTNNPSYATLCLIKSIEVRVDVMLCSQPSYVDQFPKLSFLSQTYGVIAESDINTESFRWMGSARFELGVAFNILQRKKYPCDIYVKYAAKSKNELKSRYLKHKTRESLRFQDELEEQQQGQLYGVIDGEAGYVPDPGSVTEEDFHIKYPFHEGVPNDWEKVDSNITDNLGIFYTGKMPYVAADTKFFPAALPCDGAIDMVITDSRTPFTRMAPILLALDRGSHVLQPEVIHSKILAYKLVPKLTNGLIAVDGEKFPLEPIQVEIMPRLCKTLLRNGVFVDTDFDSM